MGITNVPPFLGRTGDIAALLDHIDHVAKTFGVEAVTIGTDRPYQSLLADAAWEQVPSRGRSRTRWEALWSPDDPLFGPEWKQESMVQSLLWTNWPLFTVGLVQRGYSDDDIRKIVGGNILRVARDVWEG
jgi:membrane dipeptidase